MSNENTHNNVCIAELLSIRKQIAVIWSIADVQEVRPDLDNDQAWKVLQNCKRNHDCNEGITWNFIQTIADYVYPRQS